MNLVNTNHGLILFQRMRLFGCHLFEEFLKNGRIQKHNYQKLALLHWQLFQFQPIRWRNQRI